MQESCIPNGNRQLSLKSDPQLGLHLSPIAHNVVNGNNNFHPNVYFSGEVNIGLHHCPSRFLNVGSNNVNVNVNRKPFVSPSSSIIQALVELAIDDIDTQGATCKDEFELEAQVR
ncbi:hypothetical protein Ancab_011252 [Ancistrocladus abbreviatus]